VGRRRTSGTPPDSARIPGGAIERRFEMLERRFKSNPSRAGSSPRAAPVMRLGSTSGSARDTKVAGGGGGGDQPSAASSA